MNVTLTIRKNIIANYLGMGVVVFAPILALPWYLLALGPKQLGLIGFITMLQALLGLLDSGMSQALVREFSVRFDIEKREKAASLLFGFERVYWTFSLSAGLLMIILADSISNHWLNLDGLPIITGQQAVFGAAAIFAAQFPGSIYRSLLVGGQAQVTLNAIMASGAFLRHIGGVAVVFIWPSLVVYLMWQVTISLLETLVRGRFAWSFVRVRRTEVKWDINEVRPVWQMVALMSGASLLGSLTVQMDRLILSHMVGIEQFGYYTIAATIAIGSLQLINPLIQAVLPRAVQLRTDPNELRSLSLKLTGLIGIIVSIVAIGFLITGKGLLEIWLQNTVASDHVYPILVLLLAGAALNAFYNVGYLNWLVNRKINRLFQVNIVSLILSVMLIPPLVLSEGAIGAALGWLTINLIGFILSLGWLKRR